MGDCAGCGPGSGGVGESFLLSRRGFLGGTMGTGLSLLFSQMPFAQVLAQDAPKILPATADSCILLWMAGGPSQLDTFDPKPGRPTGGPIQTVPTSVAGVELSEHLPKIAAQMKHLALIRSMTSKEGDHQRARYYVHTGHPPEATAAHPSLGAIVARHRGNPDFDLPNFVSIGGGSVGGGYFGPDNNPFVVQRPGAPIENLKAPVGDARLERRLKLLEDLEQRFAGARATEPVEAHEAMYAKAVRMMRSPMIEAFDVSKEPEEVKAAYGKTPFGTGCLMARRLIEKGVKCVEVVLNGWDTHDDNFNRVKTLCGALDPAYATLLTDLDSKGLLKRTLVIWMGEFGRTPKINDRGGGGRDHFPKAWCSVLAGGGIRGGQVIGKTDADGQEVADRPVTVPDLFASLCRAFAVDPGQVNHAGPRPIKLVEKGTLVKELFA
ncbi:MAG: DUF1501 domain-containing protein [Planctomycetales bacterium]|nr:DUF1501 domain-containing protein [Planctomycetales bacterium]